MPRPLFREFHGLICLSRPDHIDGSIDGCPAQVAFLILEHGGLGIPPKHAEKHRLQHVLGVGSIAGDSIGRTENQAVVGSKNSLDFFRNRDYGFLSQRTLQVTPPAVIAFTTEDGGGGELLQLLFLLVRIRMP